MKYVKLLSIVIVLFVLVGCEFEVPTLPDTVKFSSESYDVSYHDEVQLYSGYQINTIDQLSIYVNPKIRRLSVVRLVHNPGEGVRIWTSYKVEGSKKHYKVYYPKDGVMECKKGKCTGDYDAERYPNPEEFAVFIQFIDYYHKNIFFIYLNRLFLISIPSIILFIIGGVFFIKPPFIQRYFKTFQEEPYTENEKKLIAAQENIGGSIILIGIVLFIMLLIISFT